ncbi:hypothetical protein R1flu_007247 [Riccia fluitans]|uniref:Uncharacterized protein n=1 Tax=Riccia fluitans TaxID=41844 RepID=A0ABD1YZ36_9MARC
MSRQIKALGVCNEATCLGPYLAHLYNHLNEMDNEEKEDSKKWKALIQIVSDSKIETEDEKELKEEIPHTAWEGEASGKAVARNMEQIFAPPLVVEVDIQPWKEMVKNLINLLMEEKKKNREAVEQRDYFEGKMRRSEKVSEIAMWCAQ